MMLSIFNKIVVKFLFICLIKPSRADYCSIFWIVGRMSLYLLPNISTNFIAMNVIIENIISRRSVKSYKDAMPPAEIIKEICKAGTYAPTGMGMQSPIIIAITNRELRDRLSRMNASIMNMTDFDPFYNAPVVLVVLAKKEIGTHVYDGTLVMENLMLAAHSFGLGSCWIHRAKEEFESEEGKQILRDLGIEGEWEGIGHCIVGYTDKEPAAQKPRKGNYIYFAD